MLSLIDGKALLIQITAIIWSLVIDGTHFFYLKMTNALDAVCPI